MWNTPEGEKTFTGPYSLALAYGLREIVKDLKLSFDDNDNYCISNCKAFANLTLEQKAWTIHKVAFGLLDRKTPIVSLTAYLEAAVATIIDTLKLRVVMEIEAVEYEIETGEYVKEMDIDDPNGCHQVRRAIWALHKKAGRNASSFLDGDMPLTVNCDDSKQWDDAIEYMEHAVLWDYDFEAVTVEDMHPDHCATTKEMFGIADDYYSSIADDPKPAEARKLLQEVDKLCDRVIQREEKKLLRKP